MPKSNIFKHFSRTHAEKYQFPAAEDLTGPEEFSEEEELEESQTPGSEPEEETEPEPGPPTPEENPIQYAQIQAEHILQDAKAQAELIVEQARQEALQEAEEVRAAARDAGHQEGYVQGMAQARSEAIKELEERAAAQAADVQSFLERAGTELDRQLDQNIGELRDLALAIAEKVICISLKSSGEVISRMIQTAVDKRKRREWVHIYIAECDAKLLGQAPASLVTALSALSDRVRIIPMADDESGTCIIEMPDEIVDASTATQLNNLRTLLTDTASSGSDGNIGNFNFR